MTDIICFDDLSFTYHRGRKPSLQGVSAEVKRGEFVVLMGEGGSGKSSLCYTTNGVIPHLLRGKYSGRVLVKDEEAASRKVCEMARIVGLVLQDFETQLFSSSVELEMAFGLENLSLSRKEIGERISKYLKFIGMEHKLRFEPSSLSGGQKQRLAIAATMCMEPEVLVMDEPTTDLDPVARREILLLAAKVREKGHTLIIADHRSETALNADSVWLMRDGEIVKRGKASEVMTDMAMLRSCRVMPPPLVELMVTLGFTKKLWAVDEAVEALEERYAAFDGNGYEQEPSNRQSPSQSTPIIEVNALTHVYRYMQVPAVREMSVNVYEGEFLAIIGPNGSGKTTLAKHFNGLLRPTAGTIHLFGRPVDSYSRKELASLVGYVFQNPDQQIFAPTVLDEVSFSLRQLCFEVSVIAERAQEVLEIVGLQEYKSEDPVRLTKGQRQRLAVASALVTRPTVIVLDEPTKGLDYPHKRELMRLMQELNKRGHTIIIITHSLWVVSEYASRVVVMNAGEAVLDEPVREAFAREERLREIGLSLPPLIRLSNRLGFESITVDNFVRELKQRAILRLPG